ncbi:hypothetical protein ACIBHY_07125 [Nonomuraea sp. NPDC050547]|uniref:hypothetical protein n=1 Tax=unclassified Nonomuraea TaxID=2593643 RepID=UPI00378B7E06
MTEPLLDLVRPHPVPHAGSEGGAALRLVVRVPCWAGRLGLGGVAEMEAAVPAYGRLG